MSSIITKKVAGKTYYYFRYAFKDSGKWKAIEQAIGPILPDQGKIVAMRESFFQNVVDTRWNKDLVAIKQRFERDVLSPGAGITKEKVLDDFGIKFTYNTNKIEGSSLTYADVRTILIHGATPRGKPMDDVIEARAHMDLYKRTIGTGEPLTLAMVHGWHRQLFDTTKPAIAGRIRDRPVRIAGSEHIPPESPYEVENGLVDLFEWYHRTKTVMHPVLMACLMKLKFVTVHPYADGNGRISRVIMNYLLYWSGYPMLNIEYKNRSTYYRALERAQVADDPMPFVHWFFSRYMKANYARVN